MPIFSWNWWVMSVIGTLRRPRIKSLRPVRILSESLAHLPPPKHYYPMVFLRQNMRRQGTLFVCFFSHPFSPPLPLLQVPLVPYLATVKPRRGWGWGYTTAPLENLRSECGRSIVNWHGNLGDGISFHSSDTEVFIKPVHTQPLRSSVAKDILSLIFPGVSET